MTEITVNDLLCATIEYGASDLHIRANMPPELRVYKHQAFCDVCGHELSDVNWTIYDEF